MGGSRYGHDAVEAAGAKPVETLAHARAVVDVAGSMMMCEKTERAGKGSQRADEDKRVEEVNMHDLRLETSELAADPSAHGRHLSPTGARSPSVHPCRACIGERTLPRLDKRMQYSLVPPSGNASAQQL
jgi:hypothetical protein